MSKKGVSDLIKVKKYKESDYILCPECERPMGPFSVLDKDVCKYICYCALRLYTCSKCNFQIKEDTYKNIIYVKKYEIRKFNTTRDPSMDLVVKSVTFDKPKTYCNFDELGYQNDYYYTVKFLPCSKCGFEH